MSDIKGLNAVWLTKTDLTNLNSGEGESNFVDVKKFRQDDIEYPYVSGQAMRFYLREAIRRNLAEKEYMCVPDDKGETCGKIKECIMCDLLGFMKTEKKVGATTRVSPLKVSPAIGLLPFDQNANVDFLTRRHRVSEGQKMEGDIVNVEVGTNIYKAGLSLDVIRVGSEEKINEDRTISIEKLVTDPQRIVRIRKVIEALKYLTDYSKQARLLTDFSPDIIAISLQYKYSHRLQKLFVLDKERNLNIQRLNEILDEVLKYSNNKIFFGMISGIVSNETVVKEAIEAKGIKVSTPSEAIETALAKLV